MHLNHFDFSAQFIFITKIASISEVNREFKERSKAKLTKIIIRRRRIIDFKKGGSRKTQNIARESGKSVLISEKLIRKKKEKGRAYYAPYFSFAFRKHFTSFFSLSASFITSSRVNVSISSSWDAAIQSKSIQINFLTPLHCTI